MLFNSYKFLLFFPIVILMYFIIPTKIRYIWLLISSYYFYMSWNPQYALLMLFSTIITYLSGIFIEKHIENLNKKKIFVFLSFSINLGILVIFKYFGFIVNNINLIFSKIGISLINPTFDLILPVGISFYTFQALSYTMDVYKKNIKAERNFLKYALFVSFFPQLVAGPIEKSRDLLYQFNRENKFEFERVKNGLILMCWGFIQKLVIADKLAVIVNNVYGNHTNYTGFHFIIATLCFSLQIYCDFSSYTDIAIGASQVMGYNLSCNFLRPYLSKSVSEFWRRWHITLGSWFREYLYIPLGGNRRGKIIKYRNILIVFLASGLWHGASWGFIIWGGLHGVYQVIGEILIPIRKKIKEILKINEDSFSHKIFKILTVYILVNFAWIFFRAPSARIAFEIIKKIFTLDIISIFNGSIATLGFTYIELFYILGSILLLISISLLRRNKSLRSLIVNQHYIFRYTIYTFTIITLVFYWISGQATGDSSFIYFQF